MNDSSTKPSNKNTRIQEYFPKKDITKIPKNRNNHLKINSCNTLQTHSQILQIRQIHAKQIYFKGKMFFASSQRIPRDELLK